MLKIHLQQYKVVCTSLFIAALFVIAKYWKQPECSYIGNVLSKLNYIHTMEHNAVLKENKDDLYETTWRDFQDIFCKWKRLKYYAFCEGRGNKKILYIPLLHCKRKLREKRNRKLKRTVIYKTKWMNRWIREWCFIESNFWYSLKYGIILMF